MKLKLWLLHRSFFFAKKIKCNYFRVCLTNALRYRELKLLKCNTQLLLTTSFVFFREKRQNVRFLAYFWQTLGGTEKLKFWKCNTQILLTTSFFFFREKRPNVRFLVYWFFSYRYKWDSVRILKKLLRN